MNILLIGDNGVGKTSFINRHTTGEFSNNQREFSSVEWNTNKGLITLNLYESTSEKLDNFPNTKIDAILLMFDITYINSLYLLTDNLIRICLQITNNIIVCGNKTDLRNRTVSWRICRDFVDIYKFKYFDISARSNYNFEKPFLFMIKNRFGTDTELVELLK